MSGILTRKCANSKLVAARFGIKRSPPPGVLEGVVLDFLVLPSLLLPGVFVGAWTPEKLVLYETDSTDRVVFTLPFRDASSFFFHLGAGPRVSPSMMRAFCKSLTKLNCDIVFRSFLVSVDYRIYLFIIIKKQKLIEHLDRIFSRFRDATQMAVRFGNVV